MNLPVPALHPAAWMAAAAVVGLGVLAYHRYASDDADSDWTMAAADQPPMRAPYPDVPSMPHTCRAMDCCTGFRSRSYPGSLRLSADSIIGEF